VTDVAEESGLGAVDLSQRFGPLGLQLVRMRVGHHRHHLIGGGAKELTIAIVLSAVRTDTCDEGSMRSRVPRTRQPQDHGSLGRSAEATRRRRAETCREIIDHQLAPVADDGGDRPIHRAPVLPSAHRDQLRAVALLGQQVEQRIDGEAMGLFFRSCVRRC
jgi:hypothetical protein